MVEIIAHRGFKKVAPENTLPAFAAAINEGSDALEMDLHVSRDGHLIVMHDETIDRTTNGSGLIKNLTMNQIKKLDAGSWFGSEFVGTKVPTFEIYLDFVIASNFTGFLLIELKTDHVAYPGIEKKVLDVLKKYKKKATWSKVILQSFNRSTLKNIHELDDNYELALLVYWPNSVDRRWRDDGLIDYIHIDIRQLLLNPLRMWTTNLASTRVWVVNDSKVLKRLFNRNALGVITNDVKTAKQVRKEQREP